MKNLLLKEVRAVLSHLSEATAQALHHAFSLQQLNRYEVLHAIGDQNDRLYFVNQGLLRVFYYQGFKNFTSCFVSEGTFLSLPDSYLTGMPTDEGIEALEPTEVLWIAKAELRQLLDRYPELERACRLINNGILLSHSQRIRMLRQPSVHLRYEYFQLTHPELLGRVPHCHIATYLGTNPSTLSRLRNRKESYGNPEMLHG